MIVKESGDYGISANAGDEEGDTAEGIEATKEKVIDIVDAHRLVACPFDKKSYMGYIKTYMVCYCLSCVVKKARPRSGSTSRKLTLLASRHSFRRQQSSLRRLLVTSMTIRKLAANTFWLLQSDSTAVSPATLRLCTLSFSGLRMVLLHASISSRMAFLRRNIKYTLNVLPLK